MRPPKRCRQAVLHSTALAVSCLVSYWLATNILSRVHFLSTADELLGGMWAVIATVFVYQMSYQRSVTAAVSRIVATLLSLALCLIYLLLLPFHPWGLAVLIGVGSLVMMVSGRSEDVVTTGITIAVVMVVAALSPHDAWEQPILRLVDTAIGIAVGFLAAWIAVRVKPADASDRPGPVDTPAARSVGDRQAPNP